MDQSLIEIDHEYGYHEYPQKRGSPFERVKVLEKARSGRWKVHFLDGPNAGLVDYAKSINIIVPWMETQPFLEDEMRLMKIIEASATQWSQQTDDPIAGAIEVIFQSTGEQAVLNNYGGHGFGHAEMPLEAARRVLMRTTLDWEPLSLDPLAFVDRFGKLHIPFQAALKLAQAFAAAEPDTVRLSVNAEVLHWELKCRDGEEYTTVELVQKWKAGWTLANKWAKAANKDGRPQLSFDDIRNRIDRSMNVLWVRLGEVERERKAEALHLRLLLEQALHELRSLGNAPKADELESKLNDRAWAVRQQ